MKEIRLTGIPIGETKTRENYYPEKPEEILLTACVVEGKKKNGFTRFLYYPQYSPEKTISYEDGSTKKVHPKLATTLMVETNDESTGIKKWETIGHVWGVSDPKLEELGFQKWEGSDYDYKGPSSRIEKMDDKPLSKEAFEEVNAWLVEQGVKPIKMKKKKEIKV
jgi:hypothetical protein